MKSRQITSKQFAWWLSVTAFAVLIWISLPQMIGLAGGLFGLSSIILMTRTERDSALNKQQVFTLILGLAGFVALLFIQNQKASEERGLAFMRLLQHPGFILPVWALGVCFVYRRWTLRKDEDNLPDQEAQQDVPPNT